MNASQLVSLVVPEACLSGTNDNVLLTGPGSIYGFHKQHYNITEQELCRYRMHDYDYPCIWSIAL